MDPSAISSNLTMPRQPAGVIDNTRGGPPRAALTDLESMHPAILTNGVTISPSEPELPAPESVNALMRRFFEMSERVTTSMLNSLSSEISANNQDQQKASRAQYEKLKEAADKCRAAKRKSPWGFLGSIFAAIGSAVLAVFTAGAATPLFGIAVASCVAASISLVNEASLLAGGPGFNPMRMLAQGIGAIAKILGADDELADKIGTYAVGALSAAGVIVAPASALVTVGAISEAAMALAKDAGMADEDATWVGLGVSLATTVLVMAYIASATAASKASAAVATRTGESAKNSSATFMRNVQRFATGGRAVTDIGDGITDVINSMSERDRAKLLGDGARLQALLVKLREEMKILEERFSTLFDEQAQNATTMSSIRKNQASTNQAIVSFA